jgi:hypothetical protein
MCSLLKHGRVAETFISLAEKGQYLTGSAFAFKKFLN